VTIPTGKIVVIGASLKRPNFLRMVLMMMMV